MADARPLRICLDARLDDGVAGGVQQTIIGLARGLSALGDGDEEYAFLVHEGGEAWLAPHLSGRCRHLPVRRPRPPPRPAWKRALERRLPGAVITWGFEALRALSPPEVPRSDGTVERLGADVVHLAHQSGFLTAVPSIYSPHDLQHEHHPEFFRPHQRRERRVLYRALCQQASAVVALTRWGRDDLLAHIDLPPARVFVQGWAPVLDLYPAVDDEDCRQFSSLRGLPRAFAYYPAQTWPHKNHLRLLEALARLRRRAGVQIPLVLSGQRNAFTATVERRARDLGLADQVHVLGFVSAREVQCLYRSCRAVLFPSLFEGFGMPVLEAFRAARPLACADGGSLAELAGEAALRFDPASVEAIAEGVRRVWVDEALRAELVRRGTDRAASASWLEVARRYRALYRSVAGRALTAADQALILALRAPAGTAGAAADRPR